MNNKKENKRTSVIVVCLVCVVVIIVLYITGIGCIFKYITGIPCLACGITRAYMSLLRGDIVQAFRYHPMFLLAPIIVLCMIEDIQPKFLKENKKFCTNIIYIIAVLLTIVYIVRIVIFKDSILRINISNGIIGRIFRYMKGI